MVSGASTHRPIAPLRRAVAAGLMTTMLLAALFQASGPGAADGNGAVGRVDVLFFFTAEDYIWGSAAANATSDAVTASRAAANDVNKAFVYERTASGPRVEIGGLAPPPGTWNWTVLQWGHNNSWEIWNGAATDLRVDGGGAMAWCPSDLLFPAPDPLSKYPWPMFRFGASRRGESLSPPPLSNLTYWKVWVGAPIVSSPCVANGKLFVMAGAGDQNHVKMLCLGESNGTLVWWKDLGPLEPQTSSPAYANGLVIFGTGAGKLLALNAGTGDLAWEHATDPPENITSSPAVVRGKVLFSGGSGIIHCLDLGGRLLWKSATGAPINLSSPAVLTQASTGDRLVAGTADGRVLCFDLADGTELWNRSLGDTARNDVIYATPAISPGGYAFVPVIQNESQGYAGSMVLYSLYLKDGAQQWNATYPASASSPALAGGGLFLGTGTEFVGHHPDRGTRSWGIPLGPVDSSPAVAGGYVYFSTSGNDTNDTTVACARVGGSLEWTLQVHDDFFSSPVVADGRLFTCTLNGNIMCIGRPPAPHVRATISVPEKPSEGARVKVKVTLNNTGETTAVFTAILTMDNNKTDVLVGPLELPPGQRREVTFEWTAKKGEHVLGVAFNGTDGTSGNVHVKVGPPSGACAITPGIIALTASAALVPLIVKWDRRGKR